ncbi:MAG: hypothetical protein ACFCD0_21545 [Gemmataceae bacterium]
MFRPDLEDSEIEFAIEGPEGPLVADFHCLRHTYVALLEQSGATLKEAMQLARHSDPKLTMAVYGRAPLEDLGEAVARLPDLQSDSGERNKTLTESQQPEADPNSLRNTCASFDFDSDSVRTVEDAKGESSRELSQLK